MDCVSASPSSFRAGLMSGDQHTLMRLNKQVHTHRLLDVLVKKREKLFSRHFHCKRLFEKPLLKIHPECSNSVLEETTECWRDGWRFLMCLLIYKTYFCLYLQQISLAIKSPWTKNLLKLYLELPIVSTLPSRHMLNSESHTTLTMVQIVRVEN